MSYTKGPWRVCGGYTPHYIGIHSSDGYIIWRMADPHEDREGDRPIKAPDYSTQRDNARLLAAAPDLLEELELLTSATSKFTKGENDDANYILMLCKYTERTAKMARGIWNESEELTNGTENAVANVIPTVTAAPELLEACKSVLNGLRNMTTEDFQCGADKKYRCQLQQAIDKAESTHDETPDS